MSFVPTRTTARAHHQASEQLDLSNNLGGKNVAIPYRSTTEKLSLTISLVIISAAGMCLVVGGEHVACHLRSALLCTRMRLCFSFSTTCCVRRGSLSGQAHRDDLLARRLCVCLAMSLPSHIAHSNFGDRHCGDCWGQRAACQAPNNS